MTNRNKQIWFQIDNLTNRNKMDKEKSNTRETKTDQAKEMQAW